MEWILAKWAGIGVSIYLGLFVLNLIMPKAGKDAINKAVYDAWFVVAQWKERIRSDWMFEARYRGWFASVAIAISLGLALFEILQWPEDFQRRGWLNFLFYGVAVPVGAGIGWLIFIFIMRRGVAGPLLRAIGVFLLMAVLALLVGFGWFDSGMQFADGDIPRKEIIPGYVGWNMAFYAQFTAAMFWWVAVIPLVAVLLLQLFLFLVEALLQHLSDAKEGALSALAGLIKVLKG